MKTCSLASSSCVVNRNNGVLIKVQVQVRARQLGILGVYNDRLKVALTVPPCSGQANRQLEELLARQFKIPISTVQVVRGGKSRLKTIFIEKLSI
jgi:Uncharacterized conserved protein